MIITAIESIDGQNINHDVEISFDYYGNIYFELYGETYQLDIDKNNDPILDIGDYEIYRDGSSINILTFDQLADMRQSKMNDKYNEADEEDDEEDESQKKYDDEDFLENENDYKYNDEFDDESDNEYEDNNYYTFEDIENKYGTGNKRFRFSSNFTENIGISLRKNGEICALYNSYIYKNEELCFRSESSDDYASCYCLKISYNGSIKFGSLGQEEHQYQLVFRDSKLLIRKIIFYL